MEARDSNGAILLVVIPYDPDEIEDCMEKHTVA